MWPKCVTNGDLLSRWLPVAGLVLLMLQSCALVAPSPEWQAQRVERAVEAGDYRAALELLGTLDPARFGTLLEQRQAIEDAAQAAGREALRLAEALAAEGEIVQALAILREARARLPDDDALRDRFEALAERQETSMAMLAGDYLRLEASSLIERRRLVTRMGQLTTDPLELPLRPDQLEREATELARALDAHATMRASPADRHAFLQLAQALAPTPGRAERLAKLAPAPATPDRARTRPMTPELRQALARDDLETAQRICAEPARDRDVSALCAEYEARREAVLEALFEEGRRLYATGDIEAAIAHWRQGHRLAPEHTGLAAALERAERVHERLETLRGQEPSAQHP